MRDHDVLASRLMMRSEPVCCFGPADVVDFMLDVESDRAALPDPRVTVRMTPASLYSTVWFTLPVVVVTPPVTTGGAREPVCCPVMMGIESDTLMMAFLFSDVITCGFDSTLTLLSDASVLRMPKNRSESKVNASAPARSARRPPLRRGSAEQRGRRAEACRRPSRARSDQRRRSRCSPTCPTLKRPWGSPVDPSRMSSVSWISATSTSISTWRGILSSWAIVASISAQLWGNA